MKLEIGQRIKTSYETGPFEIVSIIRGCTCTHILDTINGHFQEYPLPPHAHMVLRYVSEDHNAGQEAYIGYLDENTLRTYGEGGKLTDDAIILCENVRPVQRSLSFV